MNRPNILMLIPVWRRPEILRLFLWRFEAVKPDYADVTPLFVLSPEDPQLNVIEHMLEDYDKFYYTNEYLSDKLNAGLTYAMRYDWDYVMHMGSDDVYTPALWDLYYDFFVTGCRYFAINDFYVLDMVNERGMYFENYVDEPAILGGIGAGRVTHRSLVEDDPAVIRPKMNQGMDGFYAFALYHNGYQQTIVPTDGASVLLDIKTNVNVNHPIHIWDQRTREVDPRWLRQEFGLVDGDILDDGTFDLLSFDGFHTSVLHLSQNISKEDAFNSVNVRHEVAFGVPKYKNVASYYSQVTKRHGK
jgi:hypothetical protein